MVPIFPDRVVRRFDLSGGVRWFQKQIIRGTALHPQLSGRYFMTMHLQIPSNEHWNEQDSDSVG